MDVKELMAFKPAHTPKRPAPGEVSRGPDEMMDDDPTDSYEARAKKRKLAMKKAQEVIIITALSTPLVIARIYCLLVHLFSTEVVVEKTIKACK